MTKIKIIRNTKVYDNFFVDDLVHIIPFTQIAVEVSIIYLVDVDVKNPVQRSGPTLVRIKYLLFHLVHS